MVETLEFNVIFNNGKTVSGNHEFPRGMTLICGPNEAGKTLRLEMIRYALFGTPALRTKSANYSSLSVTMTFLLNEKSYKVHRTLKDAQLYEDDVLVVKGAKAVNTYITDLLGFGLDIFDVSCACNQGELEAFGNLPPAQRKQMVDHLVGISHLDTIVKHCTSRASELAKLAETLRPLVKEPDKVEEPEGYVDTVCLSSMINELTEKEKRMAWIRSNRVPEPVEPIKPDYYRPSKELLPIKQIYDKRRLLTSMLKTIPEFPFTSQEAAALVEKARLWQKYNSFPFTYDEIKSALEAIEYAKKLEKIAELRSRGTHVCPSCSYEWPIEKDAIDRLTATLKTLPKVNPKINASERELRNRLQDAPYVAPEKPDVMLTNEDIVLARKAEQRANLLEELSKLPEVEFNEEEFNNIVKYEMLLEEYKKQKAKYDAIAIYDNEYNQLAKEVDILPSLRNKYIVSKLYEEKLENYKKELAVYNERKEKLEALDKKKNSYLKAKEIVQNISKNVKTYFFPALSSVASKFVDLITEGKYKSVTMDEMMNIRLDGQDLDTLSGSTKSVVNLAIRIALGRVLVAKIFPVLLADEIDLFMDESRAKNTIDAFYLLTSHIEQIILVSHKPVEVENVIKL